MTFFDYLYYKYYRYQIKVGNADIAPFGAAIAFGVLTAVTLIAIIEIVEVVFRLRDRILNSQYGIVVLGSAIIAGCYIFFVTSGRYRDVAAHFQNESDRQRRLGILCAILWPLLVLVLLGVFVALARSQCNYGSAC